MSRNKSSSASNFSRGVKKFFLSAFVVLSFIAYTIHERLTGSSVGMSPAPISPDAVSGQGGAGSSANVPPAPPTSNPLASNPATNAPAPVQATDAPAPTATTVVIEPPTAYPTPTVPSANRGQYKDGVYTGPQVDVFYGLVQVQVTVQGGKIANVQFLDYPHDRRTSVQINNFAVPYLQQEALQVQSANVQIISGATLTSEGFAMSLENALTSAR